ncbi:MAG: SOS response-associated peptidase [Rhizobiaceae bacterium]|nr:SOS response-associated peptidase [Rhizobiaceae bacterium]
MCGRFGLIPTPDELAELFALIDLEPFPPRYNIAPTQPILMVIAAEPGGPGSNRPARRSVLVRWGLLPRWLKELKGFPLLFNARSEDAADKAAFRAAMRHRRTLVPASGFFEWRKDGPKERQPFWVRPKKGGIIAFGGLMETWSEPGGSEIDTGTILTTEANADLAPIHDRMPVVIHPQDFDRWLDCRNNEPRDVAELMRPVQPDFFEAIPVSERVNKVSNAGPDNMEPIALAPDRAHRPQRQNPEPPANNQLKLF